MHIFTVKAVADQLQTNAFDAAAAAAFGAA